MLTREQIKVGDTVYLRPVGNNARYGNTAIKTAKISKVGRKYLEVSDERYMIVKFHLEDRRHNNGQYAATWELYLTEQEIQDEDEYDQKLRKIRDVFGSYCRPSLSLDQIRKVWDAIQGEDKR